MLTRTGVALYATIAIAISIIVDTPSGAQERPAPVLRPAVELAAAGSSMERIATTAGLGPYSASGAASTGVDRALSRQGGSAGPSSAPGLMPGFPVFLGTPANANGQTYSPTLADIDGDRADEIFLKSFGHAFALRGNGSFLAGWPTRDPHLGGGAQGHLPGPSVGDLDGNGTSEVVWALRDWWSGTGPEDTRTWGFNARSADGADLPGFPKPAPADGSNALFHPFVLGDAAQAGFSSGATAHIGPGANFRLTFFARDASSRTLALPEQEWLGSVHFGDFDGDGQAEFFGLTKTSVDNNASPGIFQLHVFDEQAQEKPGYPKNVGPSWPGTDFGFNNAFAADLDGQAGLELIFGYSIGIGQIDCVRHDGARCPGFPKTLGPDTQVLQLSPVNLENGTDPTHVAVLHRFQTSYRMSLLDLHSGAVAPGWPVNLPDRTHPAAVLPGPPIVFDADDDGRQDLALAHTDGKLYVFSSAGVLLPGYPLEMGAPSISGAAVGDIDGDGFFEIVAATWDGWVYAWKISSPARSDRAYWPMSGGNARNTGVTAAPRASDIISPANNSMLPSSTVTFQWAGGIGVSDYHLYVGTSPGAYNVYEESQGTSLSRTVAGLPTQGGSLYVRLWSKIDGRFEYRDYTYTTKNLQRAPAQMTEPSNGSTLTSSSVDFQWDAGVGGTEYYLYVGTTFDGYDIYHGSQGLNQARTVTGIPSAAETIYVTLWSKIDGAYQVRRYAYSAVDGRAALTSPSNGSTFGGSTVTFAWSRGTSSGEHLYVGSSPGGYDIYDVSQGTHSSAQVFGIPTDGRTIYVRLWSRIDGVLRFRDYTYTGATLAQAPATMTSPANGTTFGSTSVTFTWSTGVGATEYYLYVGTTPLGYDIYNSSQGTSTSRTVTNLPATGSPVYVTLWTRINGTYQIRSYTYTSVEGRAAITSPTPGSTLPGRTATLSWTAGVGVSEYYLYVGTTPGGYDIYDRSQDTAQSAFVSGFPTNTKPVYVRLWSRINGVWTYRDFVFSAA